jgi:hypothetical protein
MGFHAVRWYYNKTQHKNTHITQNVTTRLKKHSTQSYTNSKGHITHNEYSTQDSEAVLATGGDVEDSTLSRQSAHTPAALYPQKSSGAMVRLERLDALKKATTPSGVEPATLRVIA